MQILYRGSTECRAFSLHDLLACKLQIVPVELIHGPTSRKGNVVQAPGLTGVINPTRKRTVNLLQLPAIDLLNSVGYKRGIIGITIQLEVRLVSQDT